MVTTRQKRAVARGWGYAALLGALVAGAPSSALAQTGISEADVIQSEEEEAAVTEEAQSVANERDALTNRPTVIITRPDVPQGEEGEEATKAGTYQFGDGKVRARLNVLSKIVARDNLDFRALNEESRQDIIQTDDRLTYGANQARMGLIYSPEERLQFDIGLGHNGLWGGDSLRNLNTDNTLFVDTLYFTWDAVDTDAFTLTARMGRQYFEIGGAGRFGGARRDYLLWDVVDGLTFDLDFKKAGKVRVLGLDVVGLQFRPDEVDFTTRQMTESSFLNQRGDTATFRYGGVYENTSLIDGLELRAFGFYADIGAGMLGESTGTDRCYGGELCNVPDNDYNWMAGTRVGYFFENELKTVRVGAYGEFARSGGVDRKDNRVGLFDVSTAGNAFGGGLLGGFSFGSLLLDVGAQYFRADGASYAGENGMMFNHGFVSFKGAHIGGVAMDDNAGWHPSAYIGGSRGVENDVQDQVRKAGTQSIFAGFGVGLVDTLKLDIGFWNLRDTGVSNIAPDRYDEVARDLPFGYAPADIYAQERVGKTLGNEVDFGLTFLASDVLSIFAQGGVFMPSDFYAIEISQQAGTALGSPTPQNFWVVTGGVALQIQ